MQEAIESASISMEISDAQDPYLEPPFVYSSPSEMDSDRETNGSDIGAEDFDDAYRTPVNTSRRPPKASLNAPTKSHHGRSSRKSEEEEEEKEAKLPPPRRRTRSSGGVTPLQKQKPPAKKKPRRQLKYGAEQVPPQVEVYRNPSPPCVLASTPSLESATADSMISAPVAAVSTSPLAVVSSGKKARKPKQGRGSKPIYVTPQYSGLSSNEVKLNIQKGGLFVCNNPTVSDKTKQEPKMYGLGNSLFLEKVPGEAVVKVFYLYNQGGEIKSSNADKTVSLNLDSLIKLKEQAPDILRALNMAQKKEVFLSGNYSDCIDYLGMYIPFGDDWYLTIEPGEQKIHLRQWYKPKNAPLDATTGKPLYLPSPRGIYFVKNSFTKLKKWLESELSTVIPESVTHTHTCARVEHVAESCNICTRDGVVIIESKVIALFGECQ